MSKKPKIPKTESSAHSPKCNVGEAGFYQSKAAWRFFRMKNFNESGYGWSDMHPDIITVMEYLHDLEQKTWDDLLNKERKKNHAVSIDDMIPAARKLLRENKMGDTSEVYSFHLSSTNRVWGIFSSGHVLDILWWDKDHQICPSTLKHS